jgi:autotransporter-associated beta strand protein
MRTPCWRKLIDRLGFFASRKLPRIDRKRLQIELLEDRLSPATLNLVGTTLTFTLDNNAAAAMSGTAALLTFDAGAGNVVTANVAAQGFGFTTGAQTSGPGSLATVTALDIVGAGGSETFTISTTGGTFPTFDVASVGTTILSTAAFSTGGSTQTYHGPVSLPTTSNVTGSSVTFASSLDDGNAAGTDALTVTGNAVFGGFVGATAALLSLSVSGASAINGGSLTTTTTQEYVGAATIGATPTTLMGTIVTFDNTLDDGNAAGADALTVTGNAVFGGSVGATAALQSLSVSGTSAINGGIIVTSGAAGQTYTGAVALGAATLLDSNNAGAGNNGSISFTSTVDGGQALTLTSGAGTDTFGAAVGGTTPLVSLFDTAGTIAINGGSIVTSGAAGQTYTGAMTLGATTLLDSNNAGAGSNGSISFTSTVDGAQALTLSSGTGTDTFGGGVGGTTPLTSLSDTAGTIAINGGAVNTTTTQEYAGATTIGATTTLTGSVVTFDATLNDGNAAGTDALTVTGNAVFGGVVGSTPLNALQVTALATINTTAITTTGAQTYANVSLGASTTLTHTGASSFTISGTTLSLSPFTLTDNAATAATTGSITAQITGSGNLIKTGNGSLTLSGTNTYTGTTTVSAGTMIAGADAPNAADGAFGHASSAILLGDANTAANNSSPSLLTGGAFTIGRLVTIANQPTTGTYTVGGNTDNSSTFSGAITINQPLTITQVATTATHALTFTGLVSGARTVTLTGGGAIVLGTLAPFSGGLNIVGAPSGGGVDISSGAGNITINNSTITNNNSASNGAGINVEVGYANILTLVNDTIDGNGKTTTPLDGGGLFFGSGTLTVTNCTIANNQGTIGGGIFFAGGTGTLTNTIVAKNTATTDNDIHGPVNPASSFNLIGDGTGLAGISNGDANSNQVGTSAIPIDPLLAPLGNYGGPTQTDALLPGSPALDRGTSAGAPAIDQRGISRPQGGFFDIGAFESRGFALTANIPETPASDTKYRGLISTDFLNADGTTSTVFAVTVTALDPLTDLKGGIIKFIVIAGANGDSATPLTASVTFTSDTGPYTAQTTLHANLIPSLVNTSYFLFATADTNPATFVQHGPNNADWKLFNQLVTTLSYSGQPKNTSQSPSAIPLPAAPIQFQPAAATTTSFNVTMLDQESQPVKVTNLPIAIQSYLGDPQSFNAPGVNTAANSITFSSPHGFKTGEALLYANGGGAMITGAAKSTYLFSPADVNLAMNTITFNAPHGLVTGQALTYENGGGVSIGGNTLGPTGGLVNSLTYYAIVVSPTVIKLANDPAHAAFGTAISLLSAGTATQSLAPTYYAIVVNPLTIRLAINADNANAGTFLALASQGGASQSLVPTGVINTATEFDLTSENTLSGAINSGITNATTQAGVAAFTNANLQIFTSYAIPYHLQALFTNPNGQSVVIGQGSTQPFFVLPDALMVTGSNFAAFGQTLFNIVIVQSDRGPVRLVSITAGQNGLPTNTVMVQAFDFSLIGGALTPAIFYNGPVVLTPSVPVTPTLQPFYNLVDGVVTVMLTPSTVFGQFTLDASTTLTNPLGSLTVSTQGTQGSGSFVRYNPGRQRGR